MKGVLAMAQVRSPSVRVRRVTSELRRLRAKAGLTLDQVGDALGMSPSKLSRVETGDRGLRVDDVSALLRHYGVPAKRRNELLDVVKQASERGWWQATGNGLPELWQTYISFETEATGIQNYEPMLIPGLLQIAEYTRAVIHGISGAASETEIATKVAARTARQTMLVRPNRPDVVVVIEESVLRRPVAEPDVMRRQLRHLVEMASRPNITVQIMPTSAGAHPGLDGAFVILDFAEDPTVVHVERKKGGEFLDKDEDVLAYTGAMRAIRAAALDPSASVELVSAVADELG
jgi:transcriptional regulator with XRE-family HTH domain